MENSVIPYYWTEKFSDPVLANCIPIYLGCTNIDTYFDKDGYLIFSYSDYLGLKLLITDILKKPETMYRKYYPYMRANRETLMNKENLIPFIIERYTSNWVELPEVTHTIKGLADFKAYHYIFYWIRLKRLLYKLYSTIFKKSK